MIPVNMGNPLIPEKVVEAAKDIVVEMADNRENMTEEDNTDETEEEIPEFVDSVDVVERTISCLKASREAYGEVEGIKVGIVTGVVARDGEWKWEVEVTASGNELGKQTGGTYFERKSTANAVFDKLVEKYGLEEE